MSLIKDQLKNIASAITPKWPETQRDKARAVRSTFMLHFLPPRVRTLSIQAPASLGLGVIAVFLFLLLCVSGFLLMFYYTPSVERAYYDMKNIIHVVPFGRFTRNAHRWAAHLMVVFTLLHIARVFCTGAYKKTRRFNWVIGVLLLMLTLGLSFTGYLLPWDQLSYWAIVVGAGLLDYIPFLGEHIKSLVLGSNEVGQSALLRFYVLHVLVLPSLFAILLALHIWRVRKDGGMALSETKEKQKENSSQDKVNAWPHLLLRLALLFQITIILVLIPTLLWDAPLEELANPSEAPNPSKSPWYFLGLQELVSYSAFWGGFVTPVVLTVIFLTLPYFDRHPRGSGVWFSKQRWLALTLFFVLSLALLTTTAIGTWFRGPHWSWVWPWSN